MSTSEFNGNLIGTAEPLIVTVDNGASRTRVALGTEVIEQTNIVVFDTDSELPKHIEQVAQTITRITGGKRPDMVGYGIAGEVSEDGSTIIKAGKLHAYGWTGQPLAATTAAALGIEQENVLLINDLVTAGLAEREADRRNLTGNRRLTDRLPEDYAGVVTAISTGTNSALYDSLGAINLEAGHWPIDKEASHPCGCGQLNDAEAWISGSAVQNRFGISGKDVPADDPRWELYRQDLGLVMTDQLAKLGELAAENGQKIHKLALFGSVALGNSGAVEYLKNQFGIEVAPTTYGDDNGLYGGYFAGLEKLTV